MKSIKVFFSDKKNSSGKISLVESDKTFTKDAKNAENVICFTDSVRKLKMPKYEKVNPFAEKL